MSTSDARTMVATVGKIMDRLRDEYGLKWRAYDEHAREILRDLRVTGTKGKGDLRVGPPAALAVLLGMLETECTRLAKEDKTGASTLSLTNVLHFAQLSKGTLRLLTANALGDLVASALEQLAVEAYLAQSRGEEDPGSDLCEVTMFEYATDATNMVMPRRKGSHATKSGRIIYQFVRASAWAIAVGGKADFRHAAKAAELKKEPFLVDKEDRSVVVGEPVVQRTTRKTATSAAPAKTNRSQSTIYCLTLEDAVRLARYIFTRESYNLPSSWRQGWLLPHLTNKAGSFLLECRKLATNHQLLSAFSRSLPALSKHMTF